MEEKVHVLVDFFCGIESDCRITTAHISVYASLWKKWEDMECKQSLIFFSYEIMPLCKISSYSTYHKIIKQLHEYGYIKYTPSYNHFLGSMVEFRVIKKM
jgi:hypothetical protein